MLDYEFWIADYVAAERSSAKEIVVSEFTLKWQSKLCDYKLRNPNTSGQ